MMKYLPVLLLLFTLTAKAQDPNPFEYFAPIEVLPPAPNAASLGRYGGVDIGLSSGAINVKVPMLNYVAGAIRLPVSLSYASNGLKVDAIGGRVGSSWNLNAGGVIARTVYGEVDEQSERIVPPADFPARSRNLINFMENLISEDGSANDWDGEPDVFTFKFQGHSGKFILDAGLNPVLLTHSGLKIERTGSNSYRITTPDGIRYAFGGAGAVETTSKATLGQACGKTFPNQSITAFYLQQIVHPGFDTVTFVYSPVNYAYTIGVNQSLFKRNTSQVPAQCGNPVNPPTPENTTCVVRMSTNNVLLTAIRSGSGGRLTFSYMDRADAADKLLSAVKVYAPDNSLKKTFELQYEHVRSTRFLNQYSSQDPTLRHRSFLSKLIEKSDAGAAGKVYQFHYDALEDLPPRLSYAQDHWGYFNGKDNNTFFAEPADAVWRDRFPEATANREPDSLYSGAGMLARIIYPTGGNDSIIYEGNTVYTQVEIPPATESVYVSAQGSGSIGIGRDTSAAFLIEKSQTVVFEGGCSFDPGSGDDDPLHYSCNMTLKNSAGTVLHSRTIRPGERFDEILFLRLGSTYQLTVTAHRGMAVAVFGGLTYEKGTPTYQYVNKAVGGVRVNSVISSSDDNPVITKRYQYGTLAHPERSSGGLVFSPIYQKYLKIFVPCGGIDCGVADFDFYSMYSNSQNTIYAYSSAVPIYYSSVIESIGDAYEGGGTEYHFTVSADVPGNAVLGNGIMHAPLTSRAWRNGKEIYRYIFKKQNGQIIPVKKVYTHYKEDSRVKNDFEAYVATKKYNASCQYDPPDNTELGAYNLDVYTHERRWFYVDTTRTLIYDKNGQNYQEYVKVFRYGNPAHALPTTVSTLRSDGKKEVTLTTYPPDYSNTGGFTGDMKANHLIAYPIEQVTYLESGSIRQLISGRITTYKAGGRGLRSQELILETLAPVAGSAFKFSSRAAAGVFPPSGNAAAFAPDWRYAPRLTYNSYDDRGNLRQSKLTDGPATSYLWDYQGMYPVAEVQNAAQSQVAYTSFEAGEKGNWSYSGAAVADASAPTGRRAYALSGGSISKGGLAASRSYLLTYWAKSGSAASISGAAAEVMRSDNGWTQYRRKVSGVSAVTFSGTVRVDALRLHPMDARMKSYTYDPLVGMTSETDASGNIRYYQYDDFQRLEAVRDLNGNLLEHYRYHYRTP